MEGLRLLVLGPLVVTQEGQPVALGGLRQRRLLLALAIRRGIRSADQLIDAVWADEQVPMDPRAALRTSMTRLRHAIGADAVVTLPNGWQLAPDVSLDADEFERLVASAARSEEAEATHRRLEVLDRALDLWRGPAYQEVADETWARGRAVRLEELRVSAIEIRFEVMLQAGRHTEAIPDLAAAVEAHPNRDKLVGAHMLALYRSGQQVAATQLFQSHRQRLLADVGLEPGSELVELDRRIVVDDPDLKSSGDSARSLDAYRLGEQIGGGAHSVVYRGTQPGLGRDVAVKIIRPTLADQPDFIRRFEEEAQLVAQLEHPHIVPLYDYWREPGKACLVFRHLAGGDLEQRLQADGTLTMEDCRRLVDQVGGALSAAHGVGVLHRDVRPANILMDESANFYLADFGIAMVGADRAKGSRIDTRADVLGLSNVVDRCLGGLIDLTSADSGNEQVPESIAAFVESFLSPGDDESRSPRRRRAIAPLSGTSPFVGLAPFTERDAHLFFGRTALIEELIGSLSQSGWPGRMLITVGPSGIGKSSVLRAGLVPALRGGAVDGSADWLYASMNPGDRPFEEVATALLRVAERVPANLASHLQDDQTGLANTIRAVLPPGSQLFLLIDQFEELFTGAISAVEVDRFLDSLVSAVKDDRCPVRIAVAIRADFWDRPLHHGGFAGLVNGSAVSVGAPSARDLEEAIAMPVVAAGAEYEPGLVSEILADVAHQPGALPLLQYTLRSLWDSQISGLLTRESYSAIGGVHEALAAGAEALVTASSDAETAELRAVMRRLVVLGDQGEVSRRRAFKVEVETGPLAKEVIDRMVDARLLTLDHDPTSNQPTVEVAHEALLSEWHLLRQWLEDDRHELRLGEHLARTARSWDESGRSDADVYRGSRLDLVEEAVAAARLRPSPLESGFLDASIAVRDQAEARQRAQLEQERRSNRRLRRLAAVVAVVAAIAILAGGLALEQRGRSAATATKAETDRLVATSASLSESDSRLAVLLALAANERELSPATLGALQTSLVGAAPTVAVLGRGTTYIDVELLSNGLVVGVRQDGLDLFDPESGDLLDQHDVLLGPSGVPLMGPFRPHQVSSSANEPRIVVAGQSMVVQVLDVDANRFDVHASWTADEEILAAAISPSGDNVVYSDVNNTVRGATSDGTPVFSFDQDEPPTLFDQGKEVFEKIAYEEFMASVPVETTVSALGGRGVVVSTGGRLRQFAWTGDEVAGPTLAAIQLGEQAAPAPMTWSLVSSAGAVVTVGLGFAAWPDGSGGWKEVTPVVESEAVNGAGSPSVVGLGVDGLERTIVVLSDGQVQEVDLATFEFSDPLHVAPSIALGAAVSDWQVATATTDGIRITSLLGAGPLSVALPRPETATSATIGPGGSTVVFGPPGAAGSYAVFDVASRKELDLSPVGKRAVVYSAVLPDPDTTTVARWRSASGALIGEFFKVDGTEVQLDHSVEEPLGSFRADIKNGWMAQMLFGAGGPGEERAVRVGPRRTFAEEVAFLPGTGGATDVTFHPTRDLLLVARPGGESVLFETNQWNPSDDIDLASVDMVIANWSRDATLVATADGAGITIRDGDSFERLQRIDMPGAGEELWNNSSLVFSGDNRTLLSNTNGNGQLWDVATGERIGREFPNYELGNSGVNWGAEPQLVTTTENSGLVWNLDTDQWFEIACDFAGSAMTAEEWEQWGPRDEELSDPC